MKRTLPILVTAVTGFLLLVANFLPSLRGIEKPALLYITVLAAAALILGAGSLLRTHSDLIRRRQAGWGYSVVVIVSFFAMLILGLGKFGAPPEQGIYALLEGAEPGQVAEVWLRDDGRKELFVRVYGGEPGEAIPLRVGGVDFGELTFGADGQARLMLRDVERLAALSVPPTLSSDPNIPVVAYDPMAVSIGSMFDGKLQRHGQLTGNYIADGTPFWWLYEYINKPLMQTTFAILAFYVASAAFRAFRARNAESILLLSTAFVILLGRTFVGGAVTDWLPETGPFSFFRVDELTGWIMSIMNTAGNRAIMIGVALGTVAVSLRILLGLDRSYLGSDKG